MSFAVSVVIPCHNAASYIAETLESVYQQRDVNLEVVVIDDGSDDDSSEIVARTFPKAMVLRTERKGPSAARNAGTSRTTHEFIQYVDADDVLAEGKIASQAAALTDTSADVAYGDWAKFTGTADRRLVNPAITRRLSSEPELDLFTDFWCPPAVYLFRRSIVEAAGGWRVNLPVIQDARFVLDCALEGGRFVYVSGVAAFYRAHESGSVSTASRTAFLRDCLVNAVEVADIWRTRGRLDNPRMVAVADVANMVARASAGVDQRLFEDACVVIDRFCPEYKGRPNSRFGWMAAVLGYRRAAQFASFVRRTPLLRPGPIR